MHERGDVDVEWDAGTTAVKDFEGEVDKPKSSPVRARTEAFGSAAILRSPALGTAPSRVVPKPAEDADAAPEPVTVKEWSAPTEASPLAKARRATSQRGAASSELPLAAPEPSVLARLAPPVTFDAPLPVPFDAPPPVTFDAPLPTLRIEKIRRGPTVRTIVAAAAVLLVVVASGTYALRRNDPSRHQPATAAAPSTPEMTTIVMPTVQSPATTLAPAIAPLDAEPKLDSAKALAPVQAKPARPVAKKKALRPKTKAARATKLSAPSTSCTALDCL